MEVVFLATAAATVAATLAAFQGFLSAYRAERTAVKEGTSLEQRVRALGSALADSARAIDDIEREVRARQQLVTELEADAKRYETLRELHREEVEAIAQLIRGEMRSETAHAGRRQFWLGFLQNLFFLALGAGLTLLIRLGERVDLLSGQEHWIASTGVRAIGRRSRR